MNMTLTFNHPTHFPTTQMRKSDLFLCSICHYKKKVHVLQEQPLTDPNSTGIQSLDSYHTCFNINVIFATSCIAYTPKTT